MGNMAKPAPENDPTEDNLEVGHRQHHAAGVPAVLKAMKMSQEQMGVRRTALTLLRVNQPTGFDCPGCAWPDPKNTHTAEFCENGAKAVAEEATLRRVDPSFFAEHPGRGLRTDCRGAARTALPGRSGVLHLRPYVERGGLPLPADGPALRHQ